MRSDFGNFQLARPLEPFLEGFSPADRQDAAALADSELETAGPAAQTAAVPDAAGTAMPALTELPPAPHQALAALEAGPSAALVSTPAWGQPPDSGSLQSLPAPDVLPPVMVSEQLPVLETQHDDGGANTDQNDDGNRMADFDFIARHDSFVQRMEAEWARISELSQRMETLRGRPSADPNFPTYSGDFYYAQEVEVEMLEQQIRTLTEQAQREMEEALPANGGSDAPAHEDESAAETARLARQNNEAAQSPLIRPAPSDMAPIAPAWSPASVGTSSPPIQTVVIEGQAIHLPTDAEGNRLQIDADGQALIWRRDGGVVALGQLDSGFAAELGSAAVLQSSLLQRVAVALGASGTVPLADALAAGGRVAGAVLSGMAVESAVIGRTLLNPALALALVPSVIGQRQEVVLADGVRYVHQGDEAWGRLEERNARGDWQPTDDRVLLVEGMGYVSVLTEDQVRQLQAPLVTPAGSPNPPMLLPLPAADQRPGVLPPTVMGPPAGPTVETLPAEQMRLDDLIIESRGFERGSAEHRAASWELYNQRPNDGWNYERWSTTYAINQNRATQANAAASDYHNQLGWGQREVTVTTVVGAATWPRRLDIADEHSQRGIEYKTGYQTASADNLWELRRDADLVRRGWQIEWVFRDRASQPLLDALDQAGIQHKFQGP
jgi:hypothetical protein